MISKSNKISWYFYNLYKAVACINFEWKVLIILFFRLKIKPGRISIAGTKDKRAVTTQRVCIFKLAPKQIVAITSRNPKVSVGNFKIRKEQLKLGDLYGNRFSIVIR